MIWVYADHVKNDFLCSVNMRIRRMMVMRRKPMKWTMLIFPLKLGLRIRIMISTMAAMKKKMFWDFLLMSNL